MACLVYFVRLPNKLPQFPDRARRNRLWKFVFLKVFYEGYHSLLSVWTAYTKSWFKIDLRCETSSILLERIITHKLTSALALGSRSIIFSYRLCPGADLQAKWPDMDRFVNSSMQRTFRLEIRAAQKVPKDRKMRRTGRLCFNRDNIPKFFAC
jgi:hypothetical protein